MVFVQVACTQDSDMFDQKNALAYVASSIGLLMMVVYSVALRKMLREDKVNFKILDRKLVTVDNYTTQTWLDPEIYTNFRRSLPNADSKTAQIMIFKLRLID